MTDITRTTHLLDSVFTTSFKTTSELMYSVKFTNSNVLEVTQKLQTLLFNMENGINTGTQLSRNRLIYVEDVRTAIDALEAIKRHYMSMYRIENIPSNTKLYTMIHEIRVSEKEPDVEKVVNKAVAELLNPVVEDKELTKKQKISAVAAAKSKERKLKALKKSSKK